MTGTDGRAMSENVCAIPAELHAEWAGLSAQLDELETALERAHRLLQSANGDIEMQQLADSLQQQVNSLSERRAALEGLAHQISQPSNTKLELEGTQK